MKSIAPVLLLAGFYAVAADSVAAPERPAHELRAGLGVDRPGAATRGGNAAVAVLLDSAQGELGGGRPEQALALLERALRIEPRNPTVWHYLGIAHLELGHYAQAEAMAAKSHSLAGGDRALRTRNAGLTAAALRASGRTIAPANDFPSLASRGSFDTELEPAATYVDTRDRYARQQSAQLRRRSPAVEVAPQPRLRAPSPAWRAPDDGGAERVPRERAARRGECWIWFPGHPARRQPVTVRCDALNGHVPPGASSIVIRQRAVPRNDRRSYGRDDSNERVEWSL